MKNVLRIASDEWRYWLRSRLALSAVGVFAVLLITTGSLTGMQMLEQEQVRTAQQAAAEETFLSQPDRHPHRMVHYGHYAFRAPVPLAVVDPGIDAVTGQAMFLEGHQQNTAMFSNAGASASLGGLSWLNPALVYQLFGPLLLIVLGYGAVVREREASTLPTLLLQGVGGAQLLFGKFLALLSMAAAALVPMFIVAWVAEGVASGAALTATYLTYLGIWAAGVLLISATFRKRAVVLATTTAVWLVVCLLIPSLAVDAVSRSALAPGKIETDLRMLADFREIGDGHNAADPAFDDLRQNILIEYGVEEIEDLPVNWRGVVAEYAEKELTDALNEYANRRMSGETSQTESLDRYGWISPMLAVASASRALAGTDLQHHHRFLAEAEEVRYAFVQGLNQLHMTQLLYEDDMNRSYDQEAERRTRLNAENWQMIDRFRFEPASLGARAATAQPSLIVLAIWFCALLGGLAITGRALRP